MKIEGYIADGVFRYGNFNYFVQKEQLSLKWKKITIEIEGEGILVADYLCLSGKTYEVEGDIHNVDNSSQLVGMT